MSSPPNDVEDEEKAKFLKHNYECYEEAKRRLQNWECPPEYQGADYLSKWPTPVRNQRPKAPRQHNLHRQYHRMSSSAPINAAAIPENQSSLRGLIREIVRKELQNFTTPVAQTPVASVAEVVCDEIRQAFSIAGPDDEHCPMSYADALRRSPSEIAALQPVLIHRSFLEELVFWMVKFEFPQKLVCFLLNMLPDITYKDSFTQTFVQHYSRISYMLTQSTDSETLSNRVVHVSVQLFSNEALSLRMTRRAHLLHIMVISLRAMMSLILQPSTLQENERNFHYVVNCGHRIAKDHCYWPLVSDLNNILTHRPVAMEFLNDTRLLDMLRLVAHCLAFPCSSSVFYEIGMNVNQRELTQHVEFEPNTYYAAFSAELEASATPLWALISHLKNEETLPLSKNVLERCLTALEDFFDSIGFKKDDTQGKLSGDFLPDEVFNLVRQSSLVNVAIGECDGRDRIW
ncbi:hypothetical protein HPB51_018894 [Rhipicephalus microplus]|uniref:E3 ubiquitin-protein ligase n=1 Tax=Rhipicephalus microplus TaxID=6941 RepID=A0A9J6D6G0_RHIMP|nr:hypothetical protein HPB51_018894 [Rhipicephalus microplus]